MKAIVYCERIRDVKGDQKRRNRYLGGRVPFGFELGANGELVKDKSQQQAIRRMIALRDAGESLRSIAATMRAAGHPLSHEGVKKIIHSHHGDKPGANRLPCQRSAGKISGEDRDSVGY